ncbi:phosphotransferase enzyme family protein [Streptomyces sp. NPDC050658]|uniref:phosphotransferase enzyme family protein n=1 Tax=unclassified Streptomyces TaxID=2593676 RepID=UPI00341285E0
METSELRRAVAAAMATASALGLPADDVTVLHNSNKLTLRLRPCDVVARVAPAPVVPGAVAQLASEVDLAQSLAEAGCPVAALDPRAGARVHEQGGYAMTLWTYYDPQPPPHHLSPPEYATALGGLHAGMRQLATPTPHFTDRVEQAQRLVANHDRTPALTDPDRNLLAETLRDLRRTITGRGATEQLLHGEPHPGNILSTHTGLRFVDLETCCRGPIEFDLAHAPEGVGEHYPATVDQPLLRDCRRLVLAMITTWRWNRDDEYPEGRRLAREWLAELREGC